jgi:hypothetical protein
MDYFKISAAIAFGIAGCRFDCQSVPDIDVYTGTDADLCAKADFHFYHDSADRIMDYQFDCGIHEPDMDVQ